MKNRRRPAAHVNHDRWLVSYADFITLLFAFFVVLYSAAEVNQRKIGQVASAIQVGFQRLGAFPPSSFQPKPLVLPPIARLLPPSFPSPSSEELVEMRKELDQLLAPEIESGAVGIRTVPEGVVVSLREVGYFDSGSPSINAHSRASFDRLAVLLAQHSFSIRIEGHTDNIPIHNSQFHSNWELSTARATEMARLLITEYKFPPERLSATGYAEFHPIAGNDTAEGRALNRRVDVVILGRDPHTS
ncbi:MAG TPA: flagellar motor protein MotB [Terriglobales bacterium]|nr:flagellar motor protein MotB [Terriglobales bacterium]